jgi:hypothetical protein
MVLRTVRIVATLALSGVIGAGVAWGGLALWLNGPQWRLLAGTMAGGLALLSILLAALLSILLAALIRPFLKGLAAALLPMVAVVLWWTSTAPSNARDWTLDVAHIARATFEGSSVTI